MTAERDTREYRSGSDPRTLRDALGCFATGVTVVTCHDDAGTPVGLTANSFTALSLDPPLLLVCVAKASASAGPLAQAAPRSLPPWRRTPAATADRGSGP